MTFDFCLFVFLRFIAKEILKLNLISLEYETEPIDLSQYDCSPRSLLYQPVAGVIDITCTNGTTDEVVSNLAIDYNSEVLLSISSPGRLCCGR